MKKLVVSAVFLTVLVIVSAAMGPARSEDDNPGSLPAIRHWTLLKKAEFQACEVLIRRYREYESIGWFNFVDKMIAHMRCEQARTWYKIACEKCRSYEADLDKHFVKPPVPYQTELPSAGAVTAVDVGTAMNAAGTTTGAGTVGTELEKVKEALENSNFRATCVNVVCPGCPCPDGEFLLELNRLHEQIEAAHSRHRNYLSAGDKKAAEVYYRTRIQPLMERFHTLIGNSE